MSTPEKLIGYKFTILSEDVAAHDLFEDKTHERVSENLYRIIQSSTKGVTIGLEGAWGSGKSTVIKLLKDKLRTDSEEKTLFFMFDAWAHDGDPLRRIFLESLIREIDPSEQDGDLKEIKEKITGRKKIVEVKTKKRASPLGKYLSLSALLIPLGSAFLGKVDYGQLAWPLSNQVQSPYYLFIFGLIFCGLPLLVLGLWIFLGDEDKATKKRSWEFFSVESTEDYTQDITENGERTSIEFEDYFKSIIQLAMAKGLIDKCIVVIDNLDRIDPSHAKNIWSTLQTFFQGRSNGISTFSWSDKLWFVIPFDREGFYKIWKAADNDEEASKSFLKKCFQLIAEVPQPVMSGWSNYVKACITQALNEWPEHERNNALSTYIRYASRLDKSPTPRDIKVFANQVGLLGAMWGGEISVEAISLYVLFKESFSTKEIREKLIIGQLPVTYQTDGNRTDICAELAGLLFGVNKKKGLQLLLGPEIKTAFNQGNGKGLASLLEDHGDAFWIAYEHSKTEWMVGAGHVDEYKIAATRAFYDGLNSHKKRIARDVEQLTRVWIDSFNNLDFSNFDYTSPLKLIIELNNEKDSFVTALHKFMTEKIKEIIALLGTDKFPEDNLSNIEKLATLLEKINKPLPNSHYQKLTSANWRLWLDSLEKSNTEFKFVLPKKDETITALVSEAHLTSAKPDDKTLIYLTKTLDIHPNSSEWKTVADQIINWMNIPNRSHNCEVLYDLAVKLTIKTADAKSKFKECLKQPQFWSSGQSSTCEDNPSLPLLVAITLEEELQELGPLSSKVKSFWSEAKGQEELMYIFDQLKLLNKLDVIWNLCRDNRNSVALQIVKSIDDQLLFSKGTGANNIDEIDWASESEIRTIAEKLAVHGSFKSNENNMKDKPLIYQGVYKIFYGLNNKGISAFIDTEITKIKKEDWKNCIEVNGELLDLVNDKNPHFSEALNDFLVEVVSGENQKVISSDLIVKLPILLSKVTDLHNGFVDIVVRAYFSADQDHLENSSFQILAPLFSQHLSDVDENSLMIRIILWINSNAKERIEWIANQNIFPFKEPLERLVELVKLGFNADDKIQNEIAKLIDDKFDLGARKSFETREAEQEAEKRE